MIGNITYVVKKKKKRFKESDNQFKQKLGCNPWLRKKTFNNRMARVGWIYGLQAEYYVTWHQNYENQNGSQLQN